MPWIILNHFESLFWFWIAAVASLCSFCDSGLHFEVKNNLSVYLFWYFFFIFHHLHAVSDFQTFSHFFFPFSAACHIKYYRNRKLYMLISQNYTSRETAYGKMVIYQKEYCSLQWYKKLVLQTMLLFSSWSALHTILSLLYILGCHIFLYIITAIVKVLL